jgi:cytochrome P450
MLNSWVDPDARMPLQDIDLFDPERYSTGSQHLAWHTLRAEAPVWPHSHGGTRFWSVTRYADVLRVLRDHRTFSSEYGTILAVMDGDNAGGRTINLMDPPRHGRIRVPTMQLLSTNAVQDRADQIRQRVRRILQPCRDGGTVDLAPLMAQLPMAVVGDIVGVPEDAWPDVSHWAMAGVAPEDPAYCVSTADLTLKEAHFGLFALFHGLLRERRTRPRDDIISTLLEVEMGGRRLTSDEIILNCYSFVMGANTTTPHAAAHLLLAMAERPNQWRALRADLGALAGAIEEGLRWSTPTNHLTRRTTAPVDLCGTAIDAGELICAWVASANRDEAVFERPYTFDIHRLPNHHLGFGYGIHYCNGAPGARLVIRQTLEELLASVDRLEPAGTATHLRSNFINGITALPVIVYPGTAGADTRYRGSDDG